MHHETFAVFDSPVSANHAIEQISTFARGRYLAIKVLRGAVHAEDLIPEHPSRVRAAAPGTLFGLLYGAAFGALGTALAAGPFGLFEGDKMTITLLGALAGGAFAGIIGFLVGRIYPDRNLQLMSAHLHQNSVVVIVDTADRKLNKAVVAILRHNGVAPVRREII